MKKCTYCGKEYPDDAVICYIDENPLSGGEPASSFEQKAIPPPLPITKSAPSKRILTERQMRIFEIALICMTAFGGSLYLSIYSLWDTTLKMHPERVMTGPFNYYESVVIWDCFGTSYYAVDNLFLI